MRPPGPTTCAYLVVLLTCDTWVVTSFSTQHLSRQEERKSEASLLLRRAHAATGLTTTPLRTLRLVGRVRSGIDTVTAAPLQAFKHVDVRLALPDNYIRVEDDGQVRRTTGFIGARGILDIEALDPRVRVGHGTPDADYRRQMRLEIARLLLGMLGDAGGTLPVTSAPHPTRASSVRLRMADLWHELDLDPVDSMPRVLRYMDTVAVWRPLLPTDRQTGISQRMHQELTEVSLTFDHRREFGQLRIPLRIIRTVNDTVYEDILLDRVDINSPLPRESIKR